MEEGGPAEGEAKGDYQRRKGNFPLAECNELSGKCFSHTPLGAWV